MRRLSFFTFALALLLVAPAGAFSPMSATPQTHPYVAGMSPTFRGGFPYLGTMQLTFDKGFIRGTFRDRSLKPGGPFSSSPMMTVNGNVNGGSVRLTIGQGLILRGGTIDSNGTISGTMNWRGGIYTFIAEIGKPG